jgi:hypothetical protein
MGRYLSGFAPRNPYFGAGEPCFGAAERSVAIIWHLVHELAENEFMPLGSVEVAPFGEPHVMGRQS